MKIKGFLRQLCTICSKKFFFKSLVFGFYCLLLCSGCKLLFLIHPLKVAKPSATLNTRVNQYTALADLGNRVFVSLTGNPTYATPNPSLASLSAQTTLVEAAITAWGPVGNRGSHAQLLDLRNKCLTLRNMLVAEAQYVTNTAAVAAGNDYVLMATLISTSGFDVKNSPSPQGALAAPQNFHQMFSATISIYTPKLKWKKPIGLKSTNNVKMYHVYRNVTNDIHTATILAETTKTSYIDTAAAPATIYYYWCYAVNNQGEGAVSSNLQVSTPA